jgi:hypothetical protein
MSWLDLAAILGLKALPAPIQSRILTDRGFQKNVGINGLVAPFSDAGRIRLGDLLDTARQVYETKASQTVKNLAGAEVRLDLHEGRVAIVAVGDEVRDQASARVELAWLSPDTCIRLEAFGVIAREFSITGPSSSKWVPILEQRPLFNDEVFQILDAINMSVPSWWTETQTKISSKHLTPSDLVPTQMQYFTTLCGPLPNGMDVDEYILGPLTAHRKTLTAESLPEGMSLLLPGCLRADASLVSILADFSDDEVWGAANRLQHVPDPFSLLGLIEIALIRGTTKPEFGALASALTEKLCGETLPRHDGLDVYSFFPGLVDFCVSRLRHIDGMMMQPSYWHWLCAFTHAGQLTRLMDDLEFDPAELTQWLAAARSQRDGLANILALRCEPTWRSDFLTRDRIRAEILGRLMGLAQKEKAKEQSDLNVDSINEKIEELRLRGISPFNPGPLEGKLRPKDRLPQCALPTDEAENLLAKIKESPKEIPWAGLENVSAMFWLPDVLRATLKIKIQTVELPQGPSMERLNPLATAALIATIHQDKELAEAVAERVFGEIDGIDDIDIVFIIFLILSGTFEKEKWIEWLVEKLRRLAYTIPIGVKLRDVGRLISELKTLLPMSQWRFGQVEALCNLSN